MRCLVLIFLLNFLHAQILKNPPYEKYVDSTRITFYWKTLKPADSRVKIAGIEVVDTSKTTEHEITVEGLKPATIYLVQIASYGEVKDSVNFVTSTSSGKRSTGRINVYFNKSVDPTLSLTGNRAEGNVDLKEKLIERINNARYSIDFCVYSFSGAVASEIADAIISAKKRGVKIRFIIESENFNPNYAGQKKLIEAGIPIVKDNTSGLMHNKFIIFDYDDTLNWKNTWVWTGSWNLTDRGTYDDYQNVIEIQDRAIAGAFKLEFDEMWNGNFGTHKKDNTPHVFYINGKRFEVYFSPSDGVSEKIKRFLETADSAIYFAMYVFTSDELSGKIKEKYDSGVVDIRGVLESGSFFGSEYEFLKTFADVLIDKDKKGYLHHKYCIVDPENISLEPSLVTGSYNWTKSAEERNDENVLIVYNYPEIVNLYLQEFARRYRENGGAKAFKLSSETAPEFKLFQNYPNPFNLRTTITYSIPEKGHVKLKIYDVLGRSLLTLVDKEQDEGMYAVDFGSERLPSGVYFYRLEFSGGKGFFSDVKKMVLIK